MPFLKKNRKRIFTLKGAPAIQGYSTTFGPYVGKNRALYISKNSTKSELKNIDLTEFYSSIEKRFSKKFGDKVYWRSNLIIDQKSSSAIEVEFIPMAFSGKFLLNVLKKCEMKIADNFELVHATVLDVGRIFHELISDEGYQSTFPRYLPNFENENPESFSNEFEKADFYVELQFTEKKIFTSKEIEVMEKLSESSLEFKIGLELVKEAIPIVIQYEIKDDFPKQQSKKTIAKPEFIILDPFGPIAIYCDSYSFHQRKRDQIFKDRRIDRKLQRFGFKVFRFSEEEIKNNIEGCIEEIKAQYFGLQHALSSNEVIFNKLMKIDFEKLSDWEKRFINSLKTRLTQGNLISLKEERILQEILDKMARK